MKKEIIKEPSKKSIIITSFLISFIFFIAVFCIIYMPAIYIKEKEINFSYSDEFKTPEYDAKSLIKDYKNEVTVENNVEKNKIGSYHVDYNLKYGIANIHKQIKVNIIDDIPPKIELTGEDNVNVCPNEEYTEEGYKAIDEYDGDLTDKVETIKEKEKITYNVYDNSNNLATKERIITYIDSKSPEISLKGNKIMYLKLGNSYKEPGYSAKDNCNGDITNKVTTSGEVNTKKTGKYTITYKVKDESNNEVSIERIVYVYKNTIASSEKGEKGVIYLTFDDGPNNSITKEILNILKDEDVKATFFVTMAGSDSVIKREYNEGHTVALHTATHNYKTVYSSVNNYFKDLDKVKNRVKKITGTDPKIIRFPGGSSNTISRNYDGGIRIMTILTSEVLNRGYRYYDWNVDSGDAGGCVKASNKSNCVYKNVTKNLSKNRANVVLMHDIKSYTKDALRDIIAYGKVNGYTFKPITESTAMVVQGVNN